ncbi:MAG: DUF1700 domain-containing protein [Clostridium sp.]
MNKEEFLRNFNMLLRSLPLNERNKMVGYYDEIIEDYIESGLDEEEAVNKLGSVGLIAEEIIRENSIVVKEPSLSGGIKVLLTILVVLGSPLWGALLLAGAALLFAGLILMCVPIIIVALVVVSFLIIAMVGIAGVPFLMMNSIKSGIFQLGIGITSLGITGIFTIIFVNITGGISRTIGCTLQRVRKIFESRRGKN